jgi:hypothetical protein
MICRLRSLSSTQGSASSVYQYALYTFKWSSLDVCLVITTAVRLLTNISPSWATSLVHQDCRPLFSSWQSSLVSRSVSTDRWQRLKSWQAIISVWKRLLASTRHAEETRQSTLFDLHLVRVSSVVFATGYALMAIAPTGLIFTLCFVISAFGYGFLPAIQSVATILHTGLSGEEDTGRLFGALGVVYVLGWALVVLFHPHQIS